MSSLYEAVIAVDIGTTATKALVVDEQGRVTASCTIEYPLLTPQPGHAEQEPEELFGAVIRGIRSVVEQAGLTTERVRCVSFSSAMHSLIAVDRELRPLTRCITWADQRAAAMAERMQQDGRAAALYKETGTPVQPMSPLVKLAWMKEHQPELHGSAACWLGIKEYVFAKLFGKLVIDYSVASATGLFHLHNLDWHAEALAAAGVTASQLPQPVPTTYVLTGMADRYVAETGLAAQTPFVVGASDGVLANLGTGAIEPGVTAVTIGTSGAIRTAVSEPVTDPAGKLFCYALTDKLWIAGGAVNNGGIALRWARDRLFAAEAEAARSAGAEPYERLIELASTAPPGAGGLLFLPLLTGERAPYWDGHARGVFFGLSLQHENRHMLRAVMEGIVLQIHAVQSLLEHTYGKASEVRVSGGFARSAFWRQMLCDALGAPVRLTQTVESSGLGAAWLGLHAIGAEPDISGIGRWIELDPQGEHEPDAELHALYTRMSKLNSDIYGQLVDQFKQIAAFQREAGALS